MGGTSFRVALACCRSAVRGSWRQAVALALLTGLLGGVALGAVAGARRTASAYGRYLEAINASDVFVNVAGALPGLPPLKPITLVSSLPGVAAHGTYIGLYGLPVVHGQVDDSFLTDSVNGSLDGEYFRQDRVTVLAGRLPPQASTTTVIITPAIAKAFGTGVGGTVSYQFQSVNAQGQPSGQPFTRSYRVAAIVEIPPALVDDSDDVEGSIFPPGATRQLLPEYYYAWIGLRLAGGTAAIPVMQQRLAALAADLQRQARKVTHQDVIGTAFSVNRSDVIHNQVQQAITPEAVALSVFGAIAALALLVLTGQGLAQLVSRSGPDIAVLRALGVTRGQAGLAAALPGVMEKLLAGEPAVAGWSEFGFAQLLVDGQVVPVLGLRRETGAVEPPTTSGRALSGPDQIELGPVTLRQLGKKIGDRIRIGIAPYERTVVITGTVTMPSFGVGAADHPSLGRGGMLGEDTLLAAEGQANGRPGVSGSLLVRPSAVAIDLAPGTTAGQRARLVHRIVTANPDGTPGGTYELRRVQASAVVNTEQMGGQPLALGAGLAAAAVLSLALTVLSLVRRRRHELALLKTIGMTRRQIRAVVAWQVTLTLLIAVVIGGPLGVVGGLLAMLPATLAARTRPAAELRTE